MRTGLSASLGVGQGAKNSHCRNWHNLKCTVGPKLDCIVVPEQWKRTMCENWKENIKVNYSGLESLD